MSDSKLKKKNKSVKKSKKNTKGRRIVRNALVSILFLAFALFMFNKSIHVPKTSTNSRFMRRLPKLKERYKDLNELSTVGSFPLPGMSETNMDGKKCSSMTVQGICTTGDYILVTAYCRGEIYIKDLAGHAYRPDNLFRLGRAYMTEHKEDHRSVIYVIDKKTQNYLTTLNLSDKNHVGGITYDGKYVWIAKSSDYELSAIDINSIKAAVKKHKDTINIDYDVNVPCDRMASFVTFYDNRLWVGYCNADEQGTGVLDGFKISYNEEENTVDLISSKEISIPYNANGAVFARVDGDVCLAVSISGGRGSKKDNRDSKVCLYEIDLNKNYDIKGFKDHGRLIMPPLMEELCIDGSNVYYIFESGGSAYSTVGAHATYAPVDTVCIGEAKKLFYWKEADYISSFESYKLTTPSAISSDEEGMNVPNYIYEYEDSTDDKEVRMLYNPYTADMAIDLAGGNYTQGLDEDLSDKLSSYGYMQIYNTMSFGGYQYANRKDELGSTIYYRAFADSIIGLKKVHYNKKIRFALIVVFSGSDMSNLVTDADNVTKSRPTTYSAIGYHNYQRYISNYLHYKYDSNGVNKGLSKVVNKFLDITKNYKFLVNKKKVSFKTILSDLGKDDSKYRLIVTGYGLGGTMANILTSTHLTGKSGYEKNVVSYTFGATGFLDDESKFNDTNIFNFRNNDDCADLLCGKNIGNEVVFTPDLSFRRYYYNECPYSGQPDDWWHLYKNNIKTNYISHDYETYKEMVQRARVRLSDVYPYSTSAVNHWEKAGYLTTNSFRNFKHDVVSANGYKIKSGVNANINVIEGDDIVTTEEKVIPYQSSPVFGSDYIRVNPFKENDNKKKKIKND